MILITGARGFVGRQVLRSLSERKISLRLVLRAGSKCELDLQESVDVIRTPDLFRAESDWWKEAFTGIDTVIHLAWYAEPGHYLTSYKNLDCLQGTISMAKVCIEAGVRRVVGVGTCAEYDLRQGILRSDSPLNPQTLYAACKAAAFQVLGQMLPQAGVDFAWGRLFYLYGEGEDSRRLVPYLHRALSRGEPAELTSGRQIRDFMDVQLAGKMIADLALSDCKGPVNICSGIPITVRQLAEQIADEYGRRDLLKFGARPDNLFDPPCVVGADEFSQ